MIARDAAARIATDLAEVGIPDATFEAEYLVRSTAAISRAQYFAGASLDDSQRERLHEAVSRRLKREPVAYIAGEREFYGLAFEVSPDVLLPRPETELLVDLALAELAAGATQVVDVGTGSGAIAVAVANREPGARVIATEVSCPATEVARRNARRHGADVHFVLANLLQPFATAEVVVANLPYIPTHEVCALEPEVRDWEPIVALDGGGDGLELVRALIDDCASRVRPRLLALEVGFGQAQTVADYCRARQALVRVHSDLGGIERVVCARWA